MGIPWWGRSPSREAMTRTAPSRTWPRMRSGFSLARMTRTRRLPCSAAALCVQERSMNEICDCCQPLRRNWSAGASKNTICNCCVNMVKRNVLGACFFSAETLKKTPHVTGWVKLRISCAHNDPSVSLTVTRSRGHKAVNMTGWWRRTH